MEQAMLQCLPARLSQSCRKKTTASSSPHYYPLPLPSPPLPQRPSWLLLPEFSPLASSHASTWQVNEGRMSQGFLENHGLDKFPEGRGQSNWLLQEPSPGWGELYRHMNCFWKRGGPTGSPWLWELVLGCASSQSSSVLCFQGLELGSGDQGPGTIF